MKAITVNPTKENIEVIEMPEPKVSFSNQVKIKMLDVGICGTDREICKFKYGVTPVGEDFLVLGHEGIGEVVEVGRYVPHIQEGDLVVPTIRRGCPQNCVSCENNEPDMCFTGDYLERGIKGFHGFMSEYIVEEARYLMKVPKSIKSFGVLLEPLSIAESALMQLGNIQRKPRTNCALISGHYHLGCKKALVLGAGPVGILASLAFARRGFHTYVYSRFDQEHAKSILTKAGIRLFSKTEYDKEEILKQTGEFDLIFEATGASKMAFDMMNLLGNNGIYFMSGVVGRKLEHKYDIELLTSKLVLKNQMLIGVSAANKQAFEHGISDLIGIEESLPGLTSSIITHRVSYRDVLPLLNVPILDEGKRSGIKTVMSFDL